MKKNISKKEELVHVKLESSELIEAKRDMLSIQRDLLTLIKLIKRYHGFRTEELQKKIEMRRKIKDLNANLKLLQKTLPILHIPEILKKDHLEEDDDFEIDHPTYSPSDKSIENQLKDIQGRLGSL